MKHERITDHVNHLRRKGFIMANLFSLDFLWSSCSLCVVCTAQHSQAQPSHTDCEHEMNLKSSMQKYAALDCERGRKIIIHSVLCRFFMPTALLFEINGTGVQHSISSSSSSFLAHTHTNTHLKLSFECIASLIAA